MPEITQIYSDEDFEQKVVFIGNGAITEPTMHYRKMGSSDSFSTVELVTDGNPVLKAKLPNPGHDFEYYVTGYVGGESVTYPAAGGTDADHVNQTVITVERVDFGKPKPAQRVEMTPGVVAGMNKYLEKYYMSWLDKPIEWLDNKTPREVSKTEAGKAKVAALIRGMGSPTTYGVEVPRQSMLRELGLPPLAEPAAGK